MTWETKQADRFLAPEVHWKEAYKHVERAVKVELSSLSDGQKLTTVELVDRLYAGDNGDTEQRLFRALKALAAHQLVAYWTAGPEERWMDRTRRPKLWHRSITATKACPKCGFIVIGPEDRGADRAAQDAEKRQQYRDEIDNGGEP